MLKIAFPYQEQLNRAWQAVVMDPRYQFYGSGNAWDYTIKLADNSWENLQMVSVNQNDEVIGFFSARIDRLTYKVSGLGIINFENVNTTFSVDLYTFLSELFTKHQFRKIEWFVIVGNPAEAMYDRIIAKYGGRIIGTRCESTMTADGILRDEKEYEIFKSDFEVHQRAKSHPDTEDPAQCNPVIAYP